MSNGLIALSAVLLAVGIIMIVKGSDVFVAAAVKLSRSIGVSELVIGATVVSIGTTLPEIITSLTAVSMELIDGGGEFMPIAIGNGLGSMCCNMGLVMGLAAVIRPIDCGKSLPPKMILLLGVSAFITAAIALGELRIWQAVILLITFVVFIAENFITAKRGEHDGELPKEKLLDSSCQNCVKEKLSRKHMLLTILALITGALIVAGGAYITVGNVEKICAAMRIPSQIIGVTVLAIGTSLPELATMLTALRKGSRDIGVGNVIGANIINGTLLLGLIGVISGGAIIDAYTSSVGIFFMLAIAAIGILPSLFTRRVSRAQGALLMLTYFAMIAVNTAYIILF